MSDHKINFNSFYFPTLNSCGTVPTPSLYLTLIFILYIYISSLPWAAFLRNLIANFAQNSPQVRFITLKFILIDLKISLLLIVICCRSASVSLDFIALDLMYLLNYGVIMALVWQFSNFLGSWKCRDSIGGRAKARFGFRVRLSAVGRWLMRRRTAAVGGLGCLRVPGTGSWTRCNIFSFYFGFEIIFCLSFSSSDGVEWNMLQLLIFSRNFGEEW